jgi:hypothetical protein
MQTELSTNKRDSIAACKHMAVVFKKLAEGELHKRDDVLICLKLAEVFILESGKSDLEEFGFIANSAFWLNQIWQMTDLGIIRGGALRSAIRFAQLAVELEAGKTGQLG